MHPKSQKQVEGFSCAKYILNVETIVIDEDKMSSDLLVIFKLSQENGNFYEDKTSIAAHVDLDNENGTYYLADNYIISFIPTSGSTIIIKITELTSGVTVYYETTLITEVDQTITEDPQP